MRLTIMRHGATASNLEHRYLGLTDEPLSEAGRAQCEQAGVFSQVERVYVSRLQRAQESAHICYPQAQMVVVPGFEEFDFGAFEGRCAAEMEDDRAYRAWVESGCTAACPDGDDRATYVDRVAQAFARVARDAQSRGEHEVVIVAHGGTIMAVFSAYADAQRESVRGYDNYFCWQVGPAQGYTAHLDIDHGIPRIRSVERLEALPPLPRAGF